MTTNLRTKKLFGMSQPLSNADGVPLFACTKCNSRHPFEELSQGHQLCKDCEGSFQVVKCNYCRTEFQQEMSNSKSSSICKKCEQLQEQNGKPGLCAYCRLLAAFIGTKCQRCTNSEKKYGSPVSCEHCRQKCAFLRKDPESKKKVDGKLLCWLCTMAYKRTLAKAKQKEAILKSSQGHHRLSSKTAADLKSSYSSLTRQNNRDRESSNNGGHHHSSNTTSSSAVAGSNSYHSRSSRKHHSHQTNQSHSSLIHRDSSSSTNSKKPRVDLKSSVNGQLASNMVSSISSLSESRMLDPNSSSDLAAVVTQLKDQVAMLNRKIQTKEKELLSKDQQIAELKSTNAREQRELREKISTLQKQHIEIISDLQTRLVNMQKQIASQAKTTKTTPTSGYVKPPMVI